MAPLAVPILVLRKLEIAVFSFDGLLLSQHRTRRGGRSRIGYIDRYAANAVAIMHDKDFPSTAFAIAWSIAHVVKTEVGRPRQDTMVKGLNRNLCIRLVCAHHTCLRTYATAIAKPLHFCALLGDLKYFEAPASPESAMLIRASALHRSTRI